jgi:hypothetical protein
MDDHDHLEAMITIVSNAHTKKRRYANRHG